jgi:hypothetical protein
MLGAISAIGILRDEVWMIDSVPWRPEMRAVAMEVLITWSMLSFVSGLAVGAAIGKASRAHKDQFLSAVFSTIERFQSYHPPVTH